MSLFRLSMLLHSIISLSFFWYSLSTHRIDAEACSIREKLKDIKVPQHSSNEGHEKADEETTLETVEVSLIFLLRRRISLTF